MADRRLFRKERRPVGVVNSAPLASFSAGTPSLPDFIAFLAISSRIEFIYSLDPTA